MASGPIHLLASLFSNPLPDVLAPKRKSRHLTVVSNPSGVYLPFSMVSLLGSCLRTTRVFLDPSFSCCLYFVHCGHSFHALSSVFVSSLVETFETPHFAKRKLDCQEQCLNSTRQSDIGILVEKVRVGNGHDEILQSLAHDQTCNSIHLSHDLVNRLLFQFKDDWKSALGVFRWAELRGYKHKSEAYDTLVDILGKMKQMDQMEALLEEMKKGQLVTLKTVGKAMRRFSGQGNGKML
ncbi:hypothetical protein GH714_029327 [Hevea brasiliensis]|uniref:Pentacotripeptide-repeat region of PRORP domain-containing protein n=1 Tax=Hevea brasiliensis TaxID=3981 RepID=A0A6A6KUZ7_HEVBR|nr:hypothetical protein GH714_029327 [Hevea brasiliensis]